MDKAFRVDTQEIVWAEELPTLMKGRSKDGLSFQCSDPKCRVRVVANSYKLTNKKVPYFSINPKLNHSEGCEEVLLNGLIGRAKDHRLTDAELRIVGYPSQLVLHDSFVEEDDLDVKLNNVGTSESTTTGGNKSSYNDIVSFDPEDGIKNSKVSSIKRIVDFYLGFERNRDVEIEVLGEVNQYRYLFRRIGYGLKHNPFIDNKIFYAPLKLFRDGALREDNDKMIFELLPHREDNTRNYKVVLSKEGLSSQKISRIRNNYKRVFADTYERFVLKTQDKDYEGYVFFLGKGPTADNPLEFNVVNSFIYFKYTDVRKTINEDV